MNKVFFGDCRESMRKMIAASIKVQMCVTSPPYFGLRDYGHPGQLGLEPTPEEYVTAMVEVFQLVRRLLADDGVLFLNLGDSYHSGASVQRAKPCGTSGKAPANYQDRDCLCGSLCGACRKAYQIGKSHNDSLPVPTPAPLPYATSREHTGSRIVRPPTLDSLNPATRNAAATPDPENSQCHESEPLRASLPSTPDESSPQHQGDFRQSAHSSECLLCGCSLQDSSQESARKEDCTCDTRGGASVSRRTGMDVLDLAYPHCTSTSLKPKDLIGIPWRVAFALQSDGWILRQDIIWQKPNPMPESVTDRCTKSHEYIFLLSKSERYHFDSDAIKEPASPASLARWAQDVENQIGSDRVPGKTNGMMKAVGGGRSKRDSFKRIGSKRAEAIPGQSAGTHREDRVESAWDTQMRNKRSVWTVPTVPYKGAHFATFPPALIEPCILAGSRANDIVIDPFFGSGTAGQVAQQLGRQWIGCELNPDYAPLQNERLAQTSLVLEAA